MAFISQSFMRIKWTSTSKAPRTVLGHSKYLWPVYIINSAGFISKWLLHKWPVTWLCSHFHSQAQRGTRTWGKWCILLTQNSINSPNTLSKKSTHANLKKCEIFTFKNIQILVLSCRKEKKVNSNNAGASIPAWEQFIRAV